MKMQFKNYIISLIPINKNIGKIIETDLLIREYFNRMVKGDNTKLIHFELQSKNSRFKALSQILGMIQIMFLIT